MKRATKGLSSCRLRRAARSCSSRRGRCSSLARWPPPFLGRAFLPPFNEGSLTVALVSPPGTPLEDGDALGREVEKTLLAFPEVVSTSRRTGRAEKDEHVQGVNASEMEVVLQAGRPKASCSPRCGGRSRRSPA